ncbi:MAG: 2Fe-2S iron-sulfur cluster-binding protein [bacterium]|nr:2Fe-2S iron-sulfur cluster-binding protein [bacterium]
MNIKINGKIYEAKAGEAIFAVCKKNGIKVPTLCSTKKFQEGVCRICVVEIGGRLVTSCNTKVCEGMEIVTESEKIEKARRINLELLWADHAGKCATCKKNQMCELQNLALEYKIENFHFIPRKGEITGAEELDLIKDNWSRVVVENENPCISRNSELCIECRRCINICPEKKFGFNYRGNSVVVGTPYEKVLDCSFCGKCVEACPTGALTDQNNYLKIVEDLDNLEKFSVAVLDLGIEEKILKAMGKISPEKDLNKLLINLGFEKIVKLGKENLKIEFVKNIKDEYSRTKKINQQDIVVFFISSRIYEKAKRDKNLDYILSEREVARLVRDKEKIKIGKIHPIK